MRRAKKFCGLLATERERKRVSELDLDFGTTGL